MADRERGPLPSHVTTPLLTRITQQAIDGDYLHAARNPRPVRRSRVPAVVAVTVLGLLLAVAAVETAEGRGARESNRASLVAEAQERRALLADQQARLADLRRSNIDDAADLAVLSDTTQGLESRVARVGALSGYRAVSGPGVRIDLDPPSNGDPANDITRLLDGLWNAGAEAVSIDGRRITAQTRVASTGQALTLDGRSLDPPFTVLAVGDPATMPARFAESRSGSDFTFIATEFGSGVELVRDDDLTLPAAMPPTTLDLPLGGPS